MEAAVDALQDYGFDQARIRRTILSLLKVYGDEGWPLIEENGYEVVVDCLLSDQRPRYTKDVAVAAAKSPSQDVESIICRQEERMTRQWTCGEAAINKGCDPSPSALLLDFEIEQQRQSSRGEHSFLSPRAHIPICSGYENIKVHKRFSDPNVPYKRHLSDEELVKCFRPKEHGKKHQKTTINSIDIARMSACKLTRRRDGCPNPMFSRLKKRKEAILSLNRAQNYQVPTSDRRSEGIVSSIMRKEAKSEGREDPALAVVNSHGALDIHSATNSKGVNMKAVMDNVQSGDSLPPGWWGPAFVTNSKEVDIEVVMDEVQSSDALPAAQLGSGKHDVTNKAMNRNSTDLPPGYWGPSSKNLQGDIKMQQSQSTQRGYHV